MKAGGHPLALLVRNLNMRSPLAAEDREAVLGLPHDLRILEPATYTLREAELPAICPVLLTGFAYRQKLTGDGDRQIVALHIPGDALDLQSLYLGIADHSIQMLTRGNVAFIPRKELHDLIRARPAVARAVTTKILAEGSMFREWVLNVGRRNARCRLAHFLCETGARLDAMGLAEEYGHSLPMTQEQLADSIGLTPVHVNRTLKVLESEGLIVRTKRNIGFPDWHRLRAVGDFNQRYLHLDQQGGARSA